MNPEYESQLEAGIRRELNALGELPSPPALADRIMRVIEQRNGSPWYRRAWQTWPMALRGASLASLILLFAGICIGGAGVMQTASAGVQASPWFESLSLVFKTVGVLVNALAVSIRHVGPGCLIACGLLLAAAYAACIGLGTVYVRIGMARR